MVTNGLFLPHQWRSQNLPGDSGCCVSGILWNGRLLGVIQEQSKAMLRRKPCSEKADPETSLALKESSDVVSFFSLVQRLLGFVPVSVTSSPSFPHCLTVTSTFLLLASNLSSCDSFPIWMAPCTIASWLWNPSSHESISVYQVLDIHILEASNWSHCSPWGRFSVICFFSCYTVLSPFLPSLPSMFWLAGILPSPLSTTSSPNFQSHHLLPGWWQWPHMVPLPPCHGQGILHRLGKFIFPDKSQPCSLLDS